MNVYGLKGRTDPGRVRENNEDAFVAFRVVDTPYLLCAAIDGVGGYEGGEVAASVTARTLQTYVDTHRTGKPLEIIKRALIESNNSICAAKEGRPAISRMGCVASAALVDLEQKMAYVAHIGDTRIYLYGPDGLRKITHDHSVVGYMEDNGDITEFQAMHHPNRNEIDRYLGESPKEYVSDGFVESGIYPIPSDGKLLLCSDGLTDCVSSSKIKEILASRENTDRKVDALVEAANAEGGKDNITVVLLEFLPDDIHSKASSDLPADTTSCGERHTLKSHCLFILAAFVLGLIAGFLLGLCAHRNAGVTRDMDRLQRDSLSDNRSSQVDSLLSPGTAVIMEEFRNIHQSLNASRERMLEWMGEVERENEMLRSKLDSLQELNNKLNN